MDDYENASKKTTMKLSALTVPQFLTHICSYGHPLTPIFIMEWIRRGCEDVIKNKEEIIKENERNVISPEAWVECAELLKKALEEKHNQ